MLPDREPEELLFFERFGALRRRVVQALDGFEERVRGQIDKFETDRSPSVAEAALAAFAELLNVLGRAVGEDPDEPR